MGIKISTNPTLQEAQTFMQTLRETMPGWRSVSGPEEVMLLAEEVGEVAKEVRKLHWQKADESETKQKLAHELVDVLNYIAGIANIYDLDLSKAYEEKCVQILERFKLERAA